MVELDGFSPDEISDATDAMNSGAAPIALEDKVALLEKRVSDLEMMALTEKPNVSSAEEKLGRLLVILGEQFPHIRALADE